MSPSGSQYDARTPSLGCASRKRWSCRSSSSSDTNAISISTPAAESFFCHARRRGISSLQGPHHAAQKFSHTHLPTPNGTLVPGAVASGAAALFTDPLGAGLGSWLAQSFLGAADG